MSDNKNTIRFDSDGNPVHGDDVTRRIGDGFTVPDGYFDRLASDMDKRLPRRDEIESPVPVFRPTLWTRVRPYVYMAAMFCGIWLMLNLFTSISNRASDGGLDLSATPSLAHAVGDEQFVEDYIIDDVSNWDILDSLVADSIDMYSLTDSIYNDNPDPNFIPDNI